MGATTPSLVFSAIDSTAALQISDSGRSPVSRPTRWPISVRALSSRPSRSQNATSSAASPRPRIESVVETRAVPNIHLGLQGTTLRIFRVETNTSEGTETASTMPARRLDLGLSILSALFSNAEIISPINTVGCTASGGSPSTASRSSATATCLPLCGLILYEVLCGASHRPGGRDGRGAPLPARQPFRGGRRAGRGWQSNDRDPAVWVVAGSPRPPQPARVAGDP